MANAVAQTIFAYHGVSAVSGGPLGGGAAEGADLTGTLIVHVRDISSDDGSLRFVLFDSMKDFLKSPVRAEIVEIEGQQGTWIVEGLPYGTYAVLVHHDLDASGKIRAAQIQECEVSA